MAKEKKPTEPLWCWISLIGFTFNFLIVEGYTRGYGLVYLEWLSLFDEGPEKTGLIGTIYGIVGIVVALVAGCVADKVSTTPLYIVASIAGPAGCLLAAYAPSVEVTYAGYGILLGIGGAISMTVTLSSVSKVFCYNRPLASGIVFAGGSIGSMLYPILFRFLTDAYSVRGTLLLLGGLQFNYLIVTFLLRKNPNDLVLDNDKSDMKKTSIDRNEIFVVQKHEYQYSNPTFVQTDNDQDTVSKTEKQSDVIASECTDAGFTELNVSTLKVTSPQETFSSQKNNNVILELKNIFTVICQPEFLLVACYHATYTFGFYGFVMYAPPYITENGLDNLQIALLLTVSAGANMIGRFFIGFLSNLECINIYILTVVCMVTVGTVTMLLPTIMLVSDALPILFFGMVLHGFMGGGVSPVQPQMVVNALGAAHSGKGLGILSVTFSVGTAVPPVLFGFLRTSFGSYQLVPIACGAGFILAAGFLIISQVLKKILYKRTEIENTIIITKL